MLGLKCPIRSPLVTFGFEPQTRRREGRHPMRQDSGQAGRTRGGLGPQAGEKEETDAHAERHRETERLRLFHDNPALQHGDDPTEREASFRHGQEIPSEEIPAGGLPQPCLGHHAGCYTEAPSYQWDLQHHTRTQA